MTGLRDKVATEVYVLRYRRGYCYDDGGWGHDQCWDNGVLTLTASSDDAARREARKELRAPSPRCHCGNFGGRVFTSLTHVTRTVIQSGDGTTTTETVRPVPLMPAGLGAR